MIAISSRTYCIVKTSYIYHSVFHPSFYASTFYRFSLEVFIGGVPECSYSDTFRIKLPGDNEGRYMADA